MVTNILNIVLIILSVLLIIFIAYMARRHRSKQENIHERFLDEEDAANAVRKKELEPEIFFVADLSGLPEISEDDPYQVVRAAKRQMIRFTEPVSNLELKQKYGVSQMDIIAQYEENFNEFLKALTNWAEGLADEGNGRSALAILEYALTLGSEFRSTYKLAADILAAYQDAGALETLLDFTSANHFYDPAVRQHIMSYINDKIDELGGAEPVTEFRESEESNPYDD